jgi:hypothetical protein
MSLTITSYLSENEIYGSGSITVRDLQPLTIEIRSGILAPPYKINIVFLTKEGEDAGVHWETLQTHGIQIPLQTHGIQINIVNFNSPMGLTIHSPINIGSFEGKEILLDFVVYTLGDDPSRAPKLFCYTVLLGKARG